MKSHIVKVINRLKNKIITSGYGNIIFYLITLYGIIYYSIFRKSSRVIYHAMVNIHGSSNGKSTLYLNSIINFIDRMKYGKKSEIINIKSDKIFKMPFCENPNIINDIRINGYSQDNNFLSSKLISEIISNEHLFKGKLLLSDNNYIDNKSILEARDFSNPVRLQYYSDSLLGNSKAIRELAKSTYFLKIAESFLGTYPYLDSITAWRTFPLSDHLNPSSHAAQLFHYDLDRLSWIKIFIYLTDVGEGDGPHVYIEGSHQIEKKRAILLKRGYVRISDKDINLIYDSSKFKKVTGSAGTILYGNTLAFHKGEAPINNERFILELQYISNNYGMQPIIIKDKDIINNVIYDNKCNKDKEYFRFL